MKRRVSLVFVSLVVLFGQQFSRTQAQSAAVPSTYSVTVVNALLGLPLTFTIYRDGARELVDRVQPASPGAAPSHTRQLFDFQAGTAFIWDVLDSKIPCGKSTTTDKAADFMVDPISGVAQWTTQMEPLKSTPAGAVVVNGIATKAMEATDPASQTRVKLWLAEVGNYVIKYEITPPGGVSRVLFEIKSLSFDKPAASVFALPAACNGIPVTGFFTSDSSSSSTPPPATPVTASTAANPTNTASAPPGLLPNSFAVPAGFVLGEKQSKRYDFNHEPMSYKKDGATANIEPEGRTWAIFMNVTPPNKTADATDVAMRAALKAQGWDLLTPSGTLIAHRMNGAQEVWFKGAAFSGDYRATIVEVGPPPRALTLPPPTAVPETIADNADFPYLLKFPGSTLKRTTRSDKSFNVAPPGVGEQLVVPPVVEKYYDLPSGVSTYEYMVVYRDALAKAGWTIIRTAASSDALVVAHYAKNGRDLFCYLHDGSFNVADIGAVNETKTLAAALAKDGHVAIYGIYFDVDKATLRPDSDTALQHLLVLLTSDSSLKLEVQGHTDNTGTSARNATLSNERAASVKTWLVGHGIADARLTPKGYGDTQPVGDNKTPEGRAKNRRVELKK